MKHYCSFSEAIREGAKVRPQAFDSYFNSGGSCAYGAGLEAMTGRITAAPSLVVEQFRYLMDSGATCPACLSDEAEPYKTIAKVIFHLNDDHQWTREQIADWLESEEEKLGYVTITESVEQESLPPALVTVGVNG